MCPVHHRLSSLWMSKSSISTFCIHLVKNGRVLYCKISSLHIGFSVLNAYNLLRVFIIFYILSVPWIGQLPESLNCHVGSSSPWICRENPRRREMLKAKPISSCRRAWGRRVLWQRHSWNENPGSNKWALLWHLTPAEGISQWPEHTGKRERNTAGQGVCYHLYDVHKKNKNMTLVWFFFPP